MLWIKEVEMVESVDDLKSPRSIRGTHGPDFEVLDAKIASALNSVIQNTLIKKKVSLEEMKAVPRANYSHDELWRCVSEVLGVPPHCATSGVTRCPSRWFWMGLRSASRTAIAACWASWGDALSMISQRHRVAAATFEHELMGHTGRSAHLGAAAGATDSRDWMVSTHLAGQT